MMVSDSYRDAEDFDDVGVSSGGRRGSSSSAGSGFFFGVLFTISQLFLFGAVILLVYFFVQHDKGFAWAGTERAKQFNLHAVLMVTGFIFLNGQAMLIYKSFDCCRRIYNKIIHTLIFVLSTACISFGFVAGFQAQDNVSSGSAAHFYSIHSWNGLLTIGLFALQFVFAFFSFLILLCCERGTRGFRAKLLPVHRTFGLIIFSLAAATVLSGLLQTARARLTGKDGKPDYKEFMEPNLVINAVGVAVLGLAVILPFIVRNCSQRNSLSRPSLNIN